MNTETEQNTGAKKAKQIVINVSEESKAKIAELKTEYNVTDKEFVEVVLELLNNTDVDTIKGIVTQVTVDKQKAKIEAKIAKIKAKLEAAKAELPE